MTNRFNSLTVVLDKDIRDDDAEYILNAMEMIKGVLSVKPKVSNIEDHVAYERAVRDLRQKIDEVLQPINI